MNMETLLINHIDFISTILELQYPSDCLSDTNKYLIIQHQCVHGLLSSVECLSYYLLMAIFMDRT